jgi:hypothetical protein
MAVPFKNHWLPVVLLEVSVTVSVSAPVMVMVGLAGLMQKVWLTAGAALKDDALPPWLAVMVTLPAFTKVTCAPAIVTLSEVVENETGSVELAVADRLKGASPKVLAGTVGKVMVCFY